MKITVVVGEDYTDQLRVRLKEYGITQGELERETGFTSSQMARWFNTALNPRLESIVKIETAIAALRSRKKRRAARAKAHKQQDS